MIMSDVVVYDVYGIHDRYHGRTTFFRSYEQARRKLVECKRAVHRDMCSSDPTSSCNGNLFTCKGASFVVVKMHPIHGGGAEDNTMEANQ